MQTKSFQCAGVLVHVNRLNENIRSLMKQRDNALKQFLKSKMECEKQNVYKLRNRVINETRKAKPSIIEQGKGNTKLICHIKYVI